MSSTKTQQTVNAIIDAALEITEKGEYLITSTAQVPTRGWTEPALVPYSYIQPPTDGIYDFTFVAVPPSGPVQQVLSRISAKEIFAGPQNLKGVRIHSETNAVEVMLRELTAKA